MLALFVVQAVPVALTPLEQEQVFCVHIRLVVAAQAVVNLVPVPQDPLQLLQEVLACEVESWYCPFSHSRHVRSAVVVQAVNLAPLPHVVRQLLQEVLECELEF